MLFLFSNNSKKETKMDQKAEHKKFMKFLADWTKNPKGSWQWQAISNQAAPMLNLLIDLVMGGRHKLDNITKQKIINIISETTGLFPEKVSYQVYSSEMLLEKTKASAKK